MRSRSASEMGSLGLPQSPRALSAVLVVLVVAGLVVLALRSLDFGPRWWDGAGATAVATAYATALAARTGGRPVVTGVLTGLLAASAVVSDLEVLRAGAAVGTAVITGVLAVLATVPTARFLNAVREVLIGLVIAAIGALAVVGFEPEVAVERFDLVVLALSFALALALVFRLGGLHGIGRRGAVVLLVGTGVVVVAITYAELFRRYGSPELLDPVFDAVRWWRSQFGAVPRPTVMLVGIPALVWGCHMRARRRQGWWVCVFGVAATSNVATVLVNPATGWGEAVLIVVYSVLPGLLLGYLVVRLDQRLTGPRGSRARRAEEAMAIRPEPSRFAPLL